MTSLVIDIGNTSTSIGYFKNGRIYGRSRCDSLFAEQEEVIPLITQRAVDCVAVASVIPEAQDRWKQLIQTAGLPAPLFIHHKLHLGVPIDYPQPRHIGADRLANAAAAAQLMGMPSVVCDFGTALTFDILDQKRGYIGGIICPGLPLMFDYLAEKTALLPHVKPVKTDAVVGRNTRQAMQIGARVGYRGMVREILSTLEKELETTSLPVCCTGGYAEWIFKEWDVEALIDPTLTLKGIGIIAELNA